MGSTVRVAAVQFATGTDIAANLATCLRMIDQAAAVHPALLVLPEFCNHSSWYPDMDYCYNVAVDLDGDFLAAIGRKAAEHAFYVMVNCTVRRADHQVTGTNILFDPRGEQVATSDKQVLMGNENNFLAPAPHLSPIIETPLAKIGMYSCMDGVIFETPRGLAVRGAQILCNSLNSFADDEASLHVPVRAGENKVFIVASNKVGALVPEDLLANIAARIKIVPEQLHGAGESQIVAPDGTVLAKAPRTGEAVIYADIDPTLADDKTRPDGTDIFKARRPRLYRPLAERPGERQYQPGAAEVTVGTIQPEFDGAAAIEEVAEIIAEATDVQLFVLPELFHIEGGRVVDPKAAMELSERMIETVTAALKTSVTPRYIATSIVGVSNAHAGVLIGREGIILQQNQLHAVQRHVGWQTMLGDSLITCDLPIGRVALIVGGDSIYPEVFRLAALEDVEIALVPTTLQEKWELETGLLERAAENRMSIVMATHPSPVGNSAIITIDEDFTLWTEWKHRPFDGNINYPIVQRATAQPGLMRGTIHPARSGNRMVSQKTDVVDGRAWWLLDPLTSETP